MNRYGEGKIWSVGGSSPAFSWDPDLKPVRLSIPPSLLLRVWMNLKMTDDVRNDGKVKNSIKDARNMLA